MSTPQTALPPGSLGLPILGETLAFAQNPFGFLEERHARYGSVFRSNVFFRKIVFLTGLEGAEAFYNPENISRENAHPGPLVDLFGGINMEMYDGPKHFALKSMALTAFDHAAIGGYLPDMQRLFEASLADLARRGEFSATAELRRIAIEAICANVMGLEPGPDTDAITRDYGIVLPGLISVPVPLPFTTFGKARAARDRLLVRIRAVIGERRRAPRADAVSRLLNAQAADGRRYTVDEVALEVHHIVIAGFIVYALMAEAMRQLAETPELRARCTQEVAEHALEGPLSMEALGQLTTCTNVILETKRFVPLVPLAFGRSKRAFTCDGREVPADWTVYLALTINNRDAVVYTNPHTFDPDRFGSERMEHQRHPLAFIPQGAEPPTGHRCLGLDYSTFLALTFLAVAIRGYEWDLPSQDFTVNWKKLPPEPRDGLRVRLQPRSR